MSDHGLSNHHSSTLNEIFDHQKHSVEWRKVKSLLDAVGTPETETFHVPNGKDVDRQMIVDLRRMLTEAGMGPDGGKPVKDQKDRDYGDNRRGNPSES